MKRLLLAFSALAFSGSAVAEWTAVSELDDTVFYMDFDHVRKVGSKRIVWELQDNKGQQPNGVQSVRAKVEYDCNEEMYRLLALTTHSGQMASGEILRTIDGASGLMAIAPGTAAWIMQKAVCSK